MIRERFHIYMNDLAAWNLVVESYAEANKLAERRGWPQTELWTLVSGPVNEIVAESVYSDLNEYKHVADSWLADAEGLAIFKAVEDAIVTERSWNELLMAADSVG